MVQSRRERRLERLQKKQIKMQEQEAEKTEVCSVETKKDKRNFFARVYEDHYKKLVILPFLLLIIAFIVIGYNVATTGDFINKAVSLKGGVTLTIPSTQDIDVRSLEQFLKSSYPQADMTVRELSEFGNQIGIIVESSADITEDQLIFAVKEKIGDFGDEYSVETLGPSLGSSFFKQTMIAVILAFIFMGLVVLLYFKTLIPSAAVILAAFSDIVVTIAIVDVMGMKISAAGIAAFLMLIGYSVDTDILLSTRVLKRKEGTLMDRIYGAMKTGLTMNITTIVAVTVGLIVTDSEIIAQIMTIILIGLLVDIINTWIQNVAILRHYVEKKGVSK